ncbi:MAG: hypothetical protein ACFCU2_00980 [Acidimicrobiia bacterium]
MTTNDPTTLKHQKHRTGSHVAYAREPTTIDGFQTTLDAAKAGAEWAWAHLYRDLAGTVTGYL